MAPCPDAWRDDVSPKETAWWVELNSLEELMAFSARYGALVVDDGPSIEIYDDYRE